MREIIKQFIKRDVLKQMGRTLFFVCFGICSVFTATAQEHFASRADDSSHNVPQDTGPIFPPTFPEARLSELDPHAHANGVSNRSFENRSSLPDPRGTTSPPVFEEQNTRNGGVQNSMILDVKVTGYGQIPLEKIREKVKARPNRPFNEMIVEEDKRTLMQTGWFYEVTPTTYRQSDGVIVVYDLLERPLLHYVRIIGNRAYPKKKLQEIAMIAPGDQIDPMLVHQAKSRIEDFYRQGGHHKIHVDILCGDRLTDRGAAFLISEGGKQRVDRVQIVGGRQIGAARLKTLVKSKPGWFYYIGGEFTREKLDEDVEMLTDYYRNLGFFFAKIDRDFEEGRGYLGFGEEDGWVTVRFIIDEGPRCIVSKVTFEGNRIHSDKEILDEMKRIKVGKPFNGDALQADILKIKDLYGRQGRVFTEVSPDYIVDSPSPNEGIVELVFQIRESKPVRYGDVTVDIYDQAGGRDSYTRLWPVLNRANTVRPGRLVNTAKIREDERRLRGSSLFISNPAQGYIPEVILEVDEEKRAEYFEDVASVDDVYRGQSGRAVPSLPARSAMPSTPTVSDATSAAFPPLAVYESHSASSGQESNDSTEVYGSFRPGTTVQRPATYGNGVPGSGGTPESGNAIAAPPGAATPFPGGTAFASSPGTGSYGSYNNERNNDHDDGIGFGGGAFPETNGSYGNNGSGYAGSENREIAHRGNLFGNVFSPYPQPYIPGPNNPSTQGGGIMGPVFPGSTGLQDHWNANFNPKPQPTITTSARIRVQEAQTGQFQMSVGVNSDSGVVATFQYKEDNFDWRRPPRNPLRFEDWRNAFRGNGERFRITAQPGTEVQRYEATWENPYFLDTDWSFGMSGYYYSRYYDEWRERRLGGTLSLGYRLTPDLMFSTYYKGENVRIDDPVYRGIPDLEAALGDNPMHTFGLKIAHDTRDNQHLSTEGHLASFSVEQIVGQYRYPRLATDLRQYFMLRERHDTSGRWVLGLRSAASWSDIDTPIFERYYAGGFTTIRGFEYRGVSPRFGWVPVGGNFEFYNSAELLFPLTADDMIRGVVFLDSGCVQSKIGDWDQKYRVSPGFGLRITIPMLGEAPIAFDFAFPVQKDPSDDTTMFSFYVGFLR